MAANDNLMDLALKITADPTEAQAAIEKLQSSISGITASAADQTSALARVNASLGTSFESLAAASKAAGNSISNTIGLYREAGIAAAQARTEIKAAFAGQALSTPGTLYPERTAMQQQLGKALNASAFLQDAANNAEPGSLESQLAFQQAELARSAALYNQSAVAAGEASTAEVEGADAATAAVTKTAEAQAAAAQEATAATQKAAKAQVTYGEDVMGASSAWQQFGDKAEQGARRARVAVESTTAAQGESVDIMAALREQYAGLAADAARLEALPFLSGEEAAGLATDRDMMAEIRTEAAGLGATIQETTGAATRGTGLWHTMNQGVIGDFRLMRYAMYAFTTPLMFTYIIPQIGRMVQGIEDGISAMEGMDAAARSAYAELVKGADEALVHFQGLTVQEQIATGYLLIHQTEERINLDIAKREAIEAQSYWHNLGLEILDVLGWASGFYEGEALAATLSGLPQREHGLAEDMKANAAATADEAQQNVLLQKQLTELGTLEKQLHKEHQKTASSTDKVAQAQERWNEVIATARVKLPETITEIDRLNAAIAAQKSGVSGTVQILKQYLELQQRGLPTVQELGFQIPGASQAPISTQIQMTDQLTAAQRLALPTEQELRRANAELAREYPNLTAAERAEWAQVMLTSDAYRTHIDQAGKVHRANTDPAGSFNSLAMQVRTAFSEMAGQITGWGGVATRVFDNVFNAVTRQIEIEQRQAAEHQITQFSMIQATLDGLKQLAPVKAIIDTAKGIEALASFNYASAAQWFAATALWGTVGAFQIASMAGAFQPGTSGSKAAVAASTAASTTSGTSAELAAGAASAAARQQVTQHTWQIIFNGPTYGGPAGVKEIVDKINGQVRFNRLQLVASHTITGRAIR